MSALPDDMYVDPRLPDAPEVRSPEDVLAEALRPYVGTEPEVWEVADRDGAEWCLSKIRQANARYAEATASSVRAIAALRAEIGRQEAFIATQAERRDHDVSFFEGKLADWLRRTYEEEAAAKVPEKKRTKSVALSAGVVKRVPPKPKVEIQDPAAFVVIHGIHSPFVRNKPEPNLTEILGFVKATEGELPTGARINPGEPTYKVEVAP